MKINYGNQENNWFIIEIITLVSKKINYRDLNQ